MADKEIQTVEVGGPLIEAEVIDRNGDLFPRDVLKKAVDVYNEQIKSSGGYITTNFGSGIKNVFGRAYHLSMEGTQVNVKGELFRDGDGLSKLIETKHLEFALGGVVHKSHIEDKDGKEVRVIDDMEIKDVSLVRDKVT